MAKSFGTWLNRYEGEEPVVQSLKKRFKAKLRETGERPSLFKEPGSVLLELTGWEQPDAGIQMEVCMASLIWEGPGGKGDKSKAMKFAAEPMVPAMFISPDGEAEARWVPKDEIPRS